MADEKQPPLRMRLKLLIDTHGKRVLFAEAGKDFTDFLFHILSLPVGTVIGLVKNLETLGSLSNLYQSIENLNNSHMQPNKTKDALLKLEGLSLVQVVPATPQTTVRNFYRCANQANGLSGCKLSVSESPNVNCSSCGRKLSVPYIGYPSEGGEGGYVKDLVTYMIMDDLVVTPLSTIASITLLNKFNVTDVSFLVEKVVDFGMDEALKLLNACMHSKMVLTEVFIKGTLK